MYKIYLSILPFLVFSFVGCSEGSDHDDPVDLGEKDVYMYAAEVSDSDSDEPYIVEGELTINDAKSEIRLLSHDGAEWNMAIRSKGLLTTGSDTTTFFIDLQNIRRGKESFVISGNAFDTSKGNFNGIFYTMPLKTIELKYTSRKGTDKVNVVLKAIIKM